MNIKFYIFIISFLCASINCTSQRKPRKVAAPPVPTVSALELFSQYSFNDAVSAIQKEIQATNKKGSPTYELRQLANRIRLGQNMIQSTEKVVFIDSFVVDKADILKTIKLSPSCGTLMTYAKACPGDTKASEYQKSSTVFQNEFGDHIIYSADDDSGTEMLYEKILLGKNWSDPKPLIIETTDSVESIAYPFLMSDGTTMYFASEGEGSLGGYDIFVTRYNSDTGEFVKAENIGMPFNSPANDYLYLIDESSGLGWFVSDRNQEENNVCIYLFIPNTSRETYDTSVYSEDEIKKFAQIHSILDTQNDEKIIDAAHKQLNNLTQTTTKSAQPAAFTFHVASGVTYHRLDEFKSATAMKNAIEWTNKKSEIQKMQSALADKRRQWTNNASEALKVEILGMEKALLDLDKRVKELETEIRSDEQKKLNL